MRHWYLIILFFEVLPGSAFTQPYDTISIGYSTSVNMIFSSPVKKWDMGLGLRIENSQEIWDVLVENSTESLKRIKLAAGIKHFEITNLFVETERAYYNFILKYEERPENLLIKVEVDNASIKKEMVVESKDKELRRDSLSNIDSLKYYTTKIHGFKNDFTNIGQVSQKMLFYLGGIYVLGDHLFFKVYIKNGGNIKYDMGFVGFFRGDKGKRGNKKRPKQDELLKPIYVSNEEKKVIESGEMIAKVYAFKKFTLSKNQNLYLQFWEGNQGERKMELVLKSKDILGAKIL